MEYLLAIGLAMFAGLFLSRLASKFNLPDVTSYLVAGVLIGPLCLGALGTPTWACRALTLWKSWGSSAMFPWLHRLLHRQ